jgi:hypothetical protein
MEKEKNLLEKELTCLMEKTLNLENELNSIILNH